MHACWDNANIDYLKTVMPDGKLTDALVYESAKKGSRLNVTIDETLKGKEITMPAGLSFTDKDGTTRSEIRIKWWEDPTRSTYKDISVIPLEELPTSPIDTNLLPNTNYYSDTEKFVFFGHYWLKGNPSLYRNNICCLDYSVAKQGYLVAYRLDNEKSLMDGKLVWV
ncbi:MAG: hypothetical protein IPK08_11855 [Bacteroidetes bacterium]|nr:hypothetical protein [Bacteroidota bacterium]